MAGDTDSPSSPPNKRRKTLKSKIEEDPISHEPQEPENSSSQRCPICFLEGGKVIRGEIDCCDHYFCFLCIMEWSKKESRCPLCRRRFTTIRRPPKDGVFARERVVKIPACDHAHHPSSNMAGQVLRYEEVTCQVCHGMADEYLLLLCDICDSAAHTYCVGLGNTVPEGDWFCLDCTTIRGEHDDNVDSSSDSDDEYLLGPSDPNISAFDIVQESCSYSSVANRYLPRIPRIPNHFALPVVRDRSTSIADEVITTPAETLPSVAASGARTLVHRRYVCTRVQELRENWNAIQSGSLSFSSSSIKSGCISSQKPENGVVIHERSGQTQSSASTSGQQPRNRDSCGLNDIDKAWKMMEIAKSRMDAGKKCSGSSVNTTNDSRKRTTVNPCFGKSSQAQSSSSAGYYRPINQVGCGTRDIKSKQHVHTNTGSSSGVQHPKLLSRMSSASKEATNVTSSFDILRSQQLGACDRRKTGKESYKCSPREKETIRHQPVKLEKDTQFRVTPQDAVAPSEGPSARHIKQAANIIHEQNRSACSVNEGAPSSFYAKPPISTSSSKLDAQKRNIGRGESCLEGQSRKDAKSEIASVVKVNLKMLTKDKPLGVDAFKEIARLSTHTIYGACGLKHSKSGMYSFPSLECPHTEQFQPPHKPSPMPNSCRACFDGFVKGVVSSILCGSAGSAKLSQAPS